MIIFLRWSPRCTTQLTPAKSPKPHDPCVRYGMLTCASLEYTTGQQSAHQWAMSSSGNRSFGTITRFHIICAYYHCTFRTVEFESSIYRRYKTPASPIGVLRKFTFRLDLHNFISTPQCSLFQRFPDQCVLTS